MQPCRFILQAIDPEYGHPAFETMFVVEQLEELRAVLGAAAANDTQLEMYYLLDEADIDAINRQFSLAFDPDGRDTSLSKWDGNREFPYLVHSGFELILMIDGRKQFARMGSEYFPRTGTKARTFSTKWCRRVFFTARRCLNGSMHRNVYPMVV
jgi:hypothetical protein